MAKVGGIICDADNSTVRLYDAYHRNSESNETLTYCLSGKCRFSLQASGVVDQKYRDERDHTLPIFRMEHSAAPNVCVKIITASLYIKVHW